MAMAGARAARRLDLLYPVTAVGLALVTWHLVVVVFQLRPTLLPTPVRALAKAYAVRDLLLGHGIVTLLEILGGFALSVAVGMGSALLMTRWRAFERTATPILVFLQTVPHISIAPLFIVWFGFGIVPKVLVSFLMAYFPVVIATTVGLKAVEADMLDLIRSMEATAWQVYAKVRIPHALPYFFSGAKIAAAFATSGAIVGEFVGSDRGLGYLLMVANSTTNSELLFATIFVVSAIGIALFGVILRLERALLPWHVATRGERQGSAGRGAERGPGRREGGRRS
ncbi:MAG: ABC transporter permease [Deltaproteobacteria bacterium]|nr:ABC transporter permease [Deltaproteobacteria bacterium]